MLEDYLADLKASLTAFSIVKDIQVLEEFITSVLVTLKAGSAC